jgi:hypothetical protein
MLPPRSGKQAHDALHQRGLADAVAAHDAGALPLWDLDVEVPEGVALAVELVQFGDGKHGGMDCDWEGDRRVGCFVRSVGGCASLIRPTVCEMNRPARNKRACSPAQA